MHIWMLISNIILLAITCYFLFNFFIHATIFMSEINWSHEPWSILNQETPLNLLYLHFYFQHFIIAKYQKYFIHFTCFIYFSFVLFTHRYAWQTTWWTWGHRAIAFTWNFFLKRIEGWTKLLPQELDIHTIESPFGKNHHCCITLHFESQRIGIRVYFCCHQRFVKGNHSTRSNMKSFVLFHTWSLFTARFRYAHLRAQVEDL
jgi:hypothetical protein